MSEEFDSTIPTVFLSHTYTPSTLGLQFIVAGTGGGVGTTTVAALLAVALTQRTGYAPRLGDHCGGTLTTRVQLIAQAGPHVVHDLGPHIPALQELTEPSVCPVIVASADPYSMDIAESVAQRRHSLVICNHVHPGTDQLPHTIPPTTMVHLHWDPALARPGLVNPHDITMGTATSLEEIFHFFGI